MDAFLSPVGDKRPEKLVKVQGAGESLNGRNQKQKYLVLTLKNKEKPQEGLVRRKSKHIMIPTPNVKLKHEIKLNTRLP